MKIWDVAVVGELYVDHILSGFETWPKPGEEVVTDDYTREIGGGAATTACGLSRLGKAVNLVGMIGEADTAWFESRLADFGLSAHGLRRLAGKTGVTISVSTLEDRSFFTHVGVNRQLGEQLLSGETLIGLTRARHVHFAMPLAHSLAARLLPLLAEAGCTTSLDVGFQPDWFADPANLATCQAVDYLMPNEKEAALLCGGEAPETYLDFARRAGFQHGLVKLGARGAMGYDGEAVCAARPPKVAALDSTGAGDAFDAGFIDALIEGVSAEERLRRACICGALSTRVPGALGALPDREELWSVYELSYGS